MIQDSVFFLERKVIRKAALLLTIPCAILPIMLATAGLMSKPVSPLLFHRDYILFGLIYGIYFYGLYLSWQTHRKLLPLGLFAMNILSLFAFAFANQAEWLGYLSVMSIMATSVSNQYFRVGSIACNEDCVV